MSTDWPSYMRRVTAGATQVQIAEQTGIEQTSISRWMLGKNRPRAELVIQFARAYHRSPVEALIAAGYLHRMIDAAVFAGTGTKRGHQTVFFRLRPRYFALRTPTQPGTPRVMRQEFSWGVTASRCSGLTHFLLQHRWSM